MKTLIKSLALALTLGLLRQPLRLLKPTPAFAQRLLLLTSQTISGKLSIALDKQTGGTVEVRLKNEKGDVLYSQRVGKNESQYRTRLNLSELPDGTYEVEIMNGVDKKTHKLTLSTQAPTTPKRLVAIN